jgi:hypothetical protein
MTRLYYARFIHTGADTLELAPHIADNFHWIGAPTIISDFRSFRPWDRVIDVLKGDSSA